ncbi:MAG: hypothetical protein Q8M31_21785 [Beijerinckiaceae bacterium]|nr:hypothetical protein [Beijerinckiaceae bacterium]
MSDRLTIADMQAHAADLHARCKPREGYRAVTTMLCLNDEDTAAIDALAKFLALAAPHEREIRRIIEGGRR